MTQVDRVKVREANRMLLCDAAVLWLLFVLCLLPLPAGAAFLSTVSLLCFLGAFMGSNLFAGVAVYGAVRYRYTGFLLSAVLLVPLAALCWYQLVYRAAR